MYQVEQTLGQIVFYQVVILFEILYCLTECRSVKVNINIESVFWNKPYFTILTIHDYMLSVFLLFFACIIVFFPSADSNHQLRTTDINQYVFYDCPGLSQICTLVSGIGIICFSFRCIGDKPTHRTGWWRWFNLYLSITALKHC